MSATEVKKTMVCLLCEAETTTEASFAVYYTVMPQSGTLLLNAVQRVVKRALKAASTSLLCANCFSLLEQLDRAEEKCKELRLSIVSNVSGDVTIDEVPGVGCQTDNAPGQLGHPCAVCDQYFKRRNELRRHMMTAHSDVKLYPCNRCDQRFRTQAGANIHANKKHGAVEPKQEFIECEADAEADVEELEDDFELDAGVVILPEEEKEALKPELDSSTESEDDADAGKSDEYADEWTGDDVVEGEDVWEVAPSDDSPGKKARNRPKVGAVAARKKTSPGGGNGGDKAKRQKKVEQVPLNCSICGKAWRTKSELRSHEATHSTERPFICEVCGQAYKHKPALDVHVGMHRGINPFCCPYCNKSFTQKGALQRHLPIHTGDAPFQCELCGKRFVHHTSFNMHTLAHTGEKSYKCATCGLALLSASHLKRHTRVHTGERPYQCPTCGKRFAERYNLAAHQRIHQHSAGKTHSCQLCGAGFDRKPKLEDHLASCHNKICEERRPAPPEPSWHHLVFDAGNKVGEDRRPAPAKSAWHHLVFDPGNKMADYRRHTPTDLEDHLAANHKMADDRRAPPSEPEDPLALNHDKIDAARRPPPAESDDQLVFDGKMSEERRPSASEPSWHHLVFVPGNKMLAPDTAARLGLLQ